jgi:hypothetical protein
MLSHRLQVNTPRWTFCSKKIGVLAIQKRANVSTSPLVAVLRSLKRCLDTKYNQHPDVDTPALPTRVYGRQADPLGGERSASRTSNGCLAVQGGARAYDHDIDNEELLNTSDDVPPNPSGHKCLTSQDCNERLPHQRGELSIFADLHTYFSTLSENYTLNRKKAPHSTHLCHLLHSCGDYG